MARIENVERLREKFKLRGKRHKNSSTIVGFTANYAVYVHENMEAKHTVGQAKFLEQPLRQLANDGTFTKIVSDVVRAGHSLGQGLYLAGLRLQREAMLLTPVDTGNLRAGAFTRQEDGKS